MSWYYAENNAQAGPVTEQQLHELVAAGRVNGSTLVWKAGMSGWSPLGQAAPQFVGASPSASSAGVSSDTQLTKRPFGQLMPETALCDSCGKFKPLDQLVMIAGKRVCADCKAVSLQALSQGEAAPGTLAYGGFWRRFGAYMLDGLILSPIYLAFYFFVLPRYIGDTAELYALVFGLTIFGMAYQTFFLGRYFATPGKMIAGLKVVKQDGSPIDYKIAGIRAAAELGLGGIPYLGGLIMLVTFGMIIFDTPQRRAIHDHLAGTRVVAA